MNAGQARTGVFEYDLKVQLTSAWCFQKPNALTDYFTLMTLGGLFAAPDFDAWCS